MSKKKTIAALLQRYNFTDFAQIVALPRPKRKDHLRKYIERDRSGRWATYKGLRSLVPDIAGVSRGLDPSEAADIDTILRGLKDRCHRDDLGFNTEAAICLFKFLRARAAQAYDDHPRGVLRIGPDRTIQMGVEHYAVEGERGIFRYIYPRRERIEGHLPDVMMSLIHHNFARDDFEGFGVEIIDLSCEPKIGPRGGIRTGTIRAPRILSLDPSNTLSRDELNAEANDIYNKLLELEQE